MKLKLRLILVGSGVFLLALLSVAVVIVLNQQSQDIRRSAEEDCDPACDGQIDYLKLRYLGEGTADVRIIQDKDQQVVFTGSVAQNEEFSFVGIVEPQETFGTQLTVFVNNQLNTQIHTSCSDPNIAPGYITGSFLIIEATSKNTGLLCPIVPIPTLVSEPTPTVTPTSTPTPEEPSPTPIETPPVASPTPTPTQEVGAPSPTPTPTHEPGANPTTIISKPTATPTQAPTACVGDQVVLDLNQNGIQESSESGISDVLVRCYTSSHELVGEATTDSTGFYQICSLVPGDYYLVFALPAGYNTSPKNIGDDGELDSDVDQDTFTTDLISLAAGANDVSVDALIYEVEEVEPTATPTPTSTPTATPSPSPTATPTATNTPTPTPTTDPSCNCSVWSAPAGVCGGGGCTSVQKQIIRTCNPTSESLNCPLTGCLNVAECAPTSTPTPTSTPRPTATPTPRPTVTPTPVVGCNELCSSNARCSSLDYICFTVGEENRCRLATNPTNSSCQPAAVVQSDRATAAQHPATLPQAGPAEWLMWLKGGLAILGIGFGLLLLL